MAQVATYRGAFVNGEWVAGNGEEIAVTNPATGENVASVSAATPEQIDQAVAAARAAFESWRKTAVIERVEICRRAFDLCMERAEEISELITRETGKTIRESREEMVEYTADHFRRAAEDVLRHEGKVLPSTQGRNQKRILVIQQPVGVVAAISPWNFPVDIAGIPIVYGLAFGCTTVWKPSELSPLCAEAFVDVLHEAGFPPGTVNLVHGRGDVGSALTRHPGVDSVVFTGSIETGEKVARDAGLKNRVLELGGNGPQIVMADANLDAAVDAAVMGCFYLAGQVCTAAERVLVQRDVHDEFVSRLVERTRQHIQDAVQSGATVVYGGESNGMYHDPTVITGVTPDMRIAREETFGPVAPIIAFDTLQEALDIANGTDFGLTAAVFTRSLADAWTAAEELRHGTVHINETTNYWDQMAPFGGAKKSGAGRELAGWIADALTETKQITFDVN